MINRQKSKLFNFLFNLNTKNKNILELEYFNYTISKNVKCVINLNKDIKLMDINKLIDELDAHQWYIITEEVTYL